MDLVKKAFYNIKEDINFLRNECNNLREELNKMRKLMIQICEIVQEREEKLQTNISKKPTYIKEIPTNNFFFKPLNDQNLPISIGNKGVPADRQTNQQTDRHNEKSTIDNAIELLDSLDNIKKELRLKFKRLTDQELLIFSTLYQLTENEEFTTYKAISDKLNLTESSIRDYISKLIKKGIPVDKTKENNKNIKLSISSNLKKIATLSTILQLRGI